MGRRGPRRRWALYTRPSGEKVPILRERGRELRARAAGVGMQQIQLDLIRGRCFNAFHGEQVVRDLLAHRSLWVSALMDRLGPGGLIKLRDLAQDGWNVDTLYVLARDRNCAQELVESSAEWRADSVDVYNAERTARAIGCSASEARVVAWWWD